MHWYRRFDRILVAAALAAGLVVVTGAPAFALGYGGDAREVAALRGAGSDRGGPAGSHPTSGAAPEIDAGAVVNALVLVVGGMLVVLDRHRR